MLAPFLAKVYIYINQATRSVEEPTMKNKINTLAARISDSNEKILVAAVIITVAICACWIAFGDVINGTAHFDFSAFRHFRP
jgi:hypothetical protein